MTQKIKKNQNWAAIHNILSKITIHKEFDHYIRVTN